MTTIAQAGSTVDGSAPDAVSETHSTPPPEKFWASGTTAAQTEAAAADRRRSPGPSISSHLGRDRGLRNQVLSTEMAQCVSMRTPRKSGP